MAITTARVRTAQRVLHPLLRRSLRRHLAGRIIDPDDESRGRFLHGGADGVARRLDEEFDAMLPVASIEDLPTAGSRINVALTVMTISLYRALVGEGVPRDHAMELTSDVVWHFYSMGGRTVHRIAGFRSHHPHRRMVAALRILLRFPFAAPGRPAYEVATSDESGGFLTTWTWCPPHAFVRQLIAAQGDNGELGAFRRSWCSFDWAFNDLLAGGTGNYSRPHTMSDGDQSCDMIWRVAPAPVGVSESPVALRSPHGARKPG